jgi:hypothetical protein
MRPAAFRVARADRASEDSRTPNAGPAYNARWTKVTNLLKSNCA